MAGITAQCSTDADEIAAYVAEADFLEAVTAFSQSGRRSSEAGANINPED
jgi:hypothetical protein